MVSLQNFLQLDDYNGVPLAAGKIYVYHQGRTELAEIYSDINGETPIANPAVLDDLGMQEIYVSNVYNYTVVATDPYNNELFTRDIYPNGVDGDGNNRLYEGIDPIVVNNDKMAISAKKATLSVQDPLYFVEDSQSAVCIGLQESAYSGLPYVENSAIGSGMAGMQPYVFSISGLGFYALSANSATLADSASISYSAENAGLVTDGWETGSDGRITAYNGTAFSAGKVYSGISPVYVNNESDLIGVSSKDFLANSPLYFTEYSDRVELSISGLPPTPGLMYESGFNYESGKITGYNGSGISAGKVYTGISPVTVDNDNDTISLDSAILGVQAPLYFVEDSESATIIGLNTAQIQIDIPESANWEEVYSTVNNNSGDWQSAADELAVLNTGKWEGAADTLSSHSGSWESKLDSAIYAADSGNFLTALPSDVVYTADIQDMATTGQVAEKLDTTAFSTVSANFLTAETDWTNTITAASAYAYSEATALIPTALTGDYIETSAMKSAQLGTSAFITGFYDGQISATLANEANKAVSANHADSAAIAGSAHSASYVFSGWGGTPTSYHTDSAIKQYYAVTGNVQGFPAGTLYKFNAYSADSAAEAASAEKAAKDSLGNVITATYLTANQPISESADWNSAASTVSAGYTLWDASYATLTANSANWDSTYTTVSDNSASWTGGATPTYSYTNNGLISAIDSSGLYATSAGTAKRLVSNGTMGENILQSNVNSDFFYMPLRSPWTTADVATGIFSPLQYATGACLAMDAGSFKAYYKGNEWFVTNTAIGQALRGEVHQSRGVHISGATTAGYGFNLGIASVSGVNSTGSWKYGHAEDVALRAVSSCDMHESAFGYDASNNITAYNGSAFKAGGEFPQSATEAIEVVTGGSANWNSTTATVATNSGAWGGQGIELSAGFGIDIQLVDNKLVISLATATGDI